MDKDVPRMMQGSPGSEGSQGSRSAFGELDCRRDQVEISIRVHSGRFTPLPALSRPWFGRVLTLSSHCPSVP